MGLMRLAQATPEATPEMTVQEAVRIMSDAHVGALAVVQGRHVVGIFTERDLMRRVVHPGKDPTTTKLSEAMTSPVQKVRDGTPIPEAATIMRDRHIRHLAIVDANDNLLGMVALRYLLYDMMEELERKVDGLEGFIMADGPGG
jgi:CBS domain-containing protein